MKSALKQFLMMVAADLVAILLVILCVFAYLNYEGKKTTEQRNSLNEIEKLNNTPSAVGYSGEIPDERPEIYEDQLEPRETVTNEDYIYEREPDER